MAQTTKGARGAIDRTLSGETQRLAHMLLDLGYEPQVGRWVPESDDWTVAVDDLRNPDFLRFVRRIDTRDLATAAGRRWKLDHAVLIHRGGRGFRVTGNEAQAVEPLPRADVLGTVVEWSNTINSVLYLARDEKGQGRAVKLSVRRGVRRPRTQADDFLDWIRTYNVGSR